MRNGIRRNHSQLDSLSFHSFSFSSDNVHTKATLKVLIFCFASCCPFFQCRKSKLPIPASKSVQFSFTHSLFSPFLFLYKTHNDIDIGFGISRSGGDGVMVGASVAIPVQCNKIDNSKMHAHTFPFLYLWISYIYLCSKSPNLENTKTSHYFSLLSCLISSSYSPFSHSISTPEA